MPPPAGIQCHMCGGTFFKSSIGFHQKQCVVKLSKQMTDCDDCGGEVSMLELKNHLSVCPAFNRGKVPPRQASQSRIPQPTQVIRANGESGYIPRSGSKTINTDEISPRTQKSSMMSRNETIKSGNSKASIVSKNDYENAFPSGMDTNPNADGAALIPCPTCGRTFVPDRIQKHAKICRKTTTKNLKRKVFNAENHRVPSDATGMTMRPRKTAPPPKPAKSNWREKSEAFRQAAQEGRKFAAMEKAGGGYPVWGQDSGALNQPGPRAGANFLRAGASSLQRKSAAAKARPPVARDTGMRGPANTSTMNSRMNNNISSNGTIRSNLTGTRTPPVERSMMERSGSNLRQPKSLPPAASTSMAQRTRTPPSTNTRGAATRVGESIAGIKSSREPTPSRAHEVIRESTTNTSTRRGEVSRFETGSGRAKGSGPGGFNAKERSMAQRMDAKQVSSRNVGGWGPAPKKTGWGREMGPGGMGGVGGGNFSASNATSADNPMLSRG